MPGVGVIFHTRTPPHIRKRCFLPPKETCHPPGSFGEDKKSVPMSASDCTQYRADERIGHLCVKQVAHGVDKYQPRSVPAQREVDLVLVQCQREPRATTVGRAISLASRIAHGLQPCRKGQRITMITSGADSIAPGRGIPGDGLDLTIPGGILGGWPHHRTLISTTDYRTTLLADTHCH